jgi:copper(I)-binding protein
MKRIYALTLALGILLSACTAPADMEVQQAWVRPTAKGENAAVYLTLYNHMDTADELLSVSAPVADVVEIHESKMENDIMQMNMLMSLPLAADEELIFTPGGLHIMLVNIKEELVLGGHIDIILHFKNHADIAVDVHIEDSMPEADHGHE